MERDEVSLSFHEIFWRTLPQYIAMGMSPEEYWEGSLELAKAYRQAYELKLAQINNEQWQMGAYIYATLGRLAPIFNSFSKVQPKPYLEQPFEVETTQKELQEERRQRKMRAGVTWMEQYAIAHNAKRGEHTDKSAE